MAYCTIKEVRAVGTQLANCDDDTLNAQIERCSRFFDHLCGVSDQFFEKSTTEPSTRMFYGDGTSYLRLDPYVAGSLSISVPSGYEAPTYIERNGYLLLTTRDVGAIVSQLPPWCMGTGWWSGLPITVTARWGYAATPADVKLAIIEMVINVLRETDPANLNLLDLERQPLREKYPPRVKQVADFYRAQQGVLV